MNSKKSYRILKDQNTFVNFTGQNIQIGDIMAMDKRNHRKVFNIFDIIDPTNILNRIETGPKSETEFMSKSSFNLEFSSQRNSAPILSHEANVSFSKSKSLYCKLENLSHSCLPIGLIEEAVKELWKEKGYDQRGREKHLHLVTELSKADKGLLIYSKSANTSAKISGNGGVPLMEEADLLKVDISVVTNSNYLLHHLYKETFTPFYKTLRYYKRKDTFRYL